ncbi:hypothetical protein ACFFMP_02390 [Pseudoroseomonas cervicalis]|uniref:Uncharacterized protein n=1 Tax=Pseudoroseomonas cervicalis ATCC 49957 TaxID=525371 RepID=D5RM80_9PROT|nr:hypothetical protein [Pseudoroseomonas cervicalis]EFH11596.1 hypothetical protein HMPREF0731_2191 [Pseudoroseomonas cervicalis ATCC 49957]
MTTVRLVAGEDRRPRLRDGTLVPAEGVDANLDTDIHLRRLYRVGDLVLANAEGGQTMAAPADAEQATVPRSPRSR